MPTRFLHSGGAGDVIYSLPFMRHHGGGSLYIKPYNEFNKSCNVYETLKPLLERQSYIDSVHPYDPARKFFNMDPSVLIDVNLDAFRNAIEPDRTVLPISYFNAFGIPLPTDWARPWLKVDPVFPSGNTSPFAIVSLTPRYRNPLTDWRGTIAMALVQHKRLFFLGLPQEYWHFFKMINNSVLYLETADFLQAAGYIAAASAVYCNQNPCLTIAQAMRKKCFLESAPRSTSCILGLEEVIPSG